MRFILPLAILCVWVAGCTPAPPPREDSLKTTLSTTFAGATHELTAEEAYYLSNPADNLPPDGYYQVGSDFLVLENLGAYCKVRDSFGHESYVATRSLKLIK